MSCSTGGGHNTAALAIKEELEKRGHEVVFMDPYTLISDITSEAVGGAYVKLVQVMPKVFGGLYRAGEKVSMLPFKSPVYFANFRATLRLRDYLLENDFDGIITSHIYPGEMLTMLRNRGIKLPKVYHIATDYVCIPFTSETEPDYFFVPGEDQIQDFVKKKADPLKLVPLGIPVREAFDRHCINGKAYEIEKNDNKEVLGLDKNCRYILVAGGSVGAGDINRVYDMLVEYCRRYNDKVVGEGRGKRLKAIVICGNNKSLYTTLCKKYSDNVDIITSTPLIGNYMKASDIVISKPGGLSSTEAAVANVPLIHISPIPGCESYNVKYFNENGISKYVKNISKELIPAINRLLLKENRNEMRRVQRQKINCKAREEITDFIENQSR